MSSIFNEMAQRYDELRPVESQVLAALSHKLRMLPDARVLLDVGCGTGRYSIPLAKKLDLELVGVDISRSMLNEARKKWPRGLWLHGRIRELLREGNIGPVDAALFAYVLHCLDWQTALESLRPSLSLGGVVLIVTYEPKVFEQALYHRFVPGLIEIDQRRFPESSEVLRKLGALGLSATKDVVITRHRLETIRDVKAAIEKGRARYCSTLRLVEEHVVQQALVEMEEALLEMIKSEPFELVYEHTLITGKVMS